MTSKTVHSLNVGSKKTKKVVHDYTKFKEDGANHQIEEVGAKLRAMMPFINEGKEKVVVK